MIEPVRKVVQLGGGGHNAVELFVTVVANELLLEVRSALDVGQPHATIISVPRAKAEEAIAAMQDALAARTILELGEKWTEEKQKGG